MDMACWAAPTTCSSSRDRKKTLLTIQWTTPRLVMCPSSARPPILMMGAIHSMAPSATRAPISWDVVAKLVGFPHGTYQPHGTHMRKNSGRRYVLSSLTLRSRPAIRLLPIVDLRRSATPWPLFRHSMLGVHSPM